MFGSKFFVFGGRNYGKDLNDMWALDLNTHTIGHRFFEPFWLDIFAVKSNPVWESYEPSPGSEKPPPRINHVLVTTYHPVRSPHTLSLLPCYNTWQIR
jgi:hypothetical protein